MLKVNGSELYRIMSCVGSIGLGAQVAYDVPDSEAAEEGTAAHWVAAQVLNGLRPQPVAGDKTPAGYVVTAEMLEHAEAYAARVRADLDLITQYEAPAHWKIGNTVEIRVRADCIAHAPSHNALGVVDYKYGFRVVEPEENWQLIAGAIGAAFALEATPERFALAIFQPRAPHPDGPWRVWNVTASELVDRYNMLANRFANITDELHTGPHCRYCKAAAVCPAATRAGYNAVDVAMNAAQVQFNDNGLRAELDVLDRAEEMLKQRREWLEGHALARMRDGVTLPGLYTARALGQTAWKGGIGQIESALGMKLTEPKPITPAEAKRRYATAEQKAAIDEHTERPDLGVRLKRGDPTKEAAKVFKNAPG